MSEEVKGITKRIEELRDKAQGSKFSHWLACHPCFNPKAHFQYSRIHLPVAPRCNIQCGYCKRGIDKCEYRPGVTCTIMKPEEAAKLVDELVKRDEKLTVVAVAGPGEPLFNDETFETFKLINERHPNLIKCVATNGLLLQEKVPVLKSLGVRAITVTINALNPEVASKIYEFVILNGEIIRGLEASKILIERQLKGLKAATNEGLVVKVNTVLIPGLNEGEAVEVAKKAAELGAFIQNIIPLIPLHSFRDHRPPTCEELNRVREEASKYIKQFRLCKQCRADAYGVPGFEKRPASKEQDFYLTFHA
ncbi:MAG: radical SAM protein [Candidatus Nezhaarchaeales archaeon]|nr:MAG: nitrogenase molybdenum-iron cofactor biosynthesis protein [Candidatus Nezhaarchaeota archaeon WYZ-LMO8]